MKQYLLVVLCLILPLSASAKLGDTKEQCGKRYGVRQLFDNDLPDFEIYHLTQSEDLYKVWVRFENDSATKITFFRADGEELPESFIQEMVREYTDDAEAIRVAKKLLTEINPGVRLNKVMVYMSLTKTSLVIEATE